jgi:phage tail protein X
MMMGVRGVLGELPRLTSPFASGISHAHAGLAELRPPLPSTISFAIAAVTAR